MANLSAKDFYNAFIKEVYPDRDIDGRKLLDIYRNGAEFTPVVTKIINQIIKDAGYKSQNEYFRIDAVGWISQHELMENDPQGKNIDINAHLWDLKIAVEHENSLSDWSDEVMKLIHVKCPLKVIIGYNYCDERNEDDPNSLERKKLNFVSKWMQRIDALKKGSGEEEYLIILGNARGRKKETAEYKTFDYKGYLYNWQSNEFENLK